MRFKIIASIFHLVLFSAAFGQQYTGKVGINTEEPKEIFDVNGTMRVRELPNRNGGKIYNGNDTKQTDFIPTKTVIADTNGVLGTAERFYDPAKIFPAYAKLDPNITIEENGYHSIVGGELSCIQLSLNLTGNTSVTKQAQLFIRLNPDNTAQKCQSSDGTLQMPASGKLFTIIMYSLNNSNSISANNPYARYDLGTDWINAAGGKQSVLYNPVWRSGVIHLPEIAQSYRFFATATRYDSSLPVATFVHLTRLR
ncbi:hypothetical protein SAMN05443429_10173 [Cruoricaptor ignavus]|uniref:Uncharacterized protein n=1 Tax=Cruoricaptor ignavus TaxID=1118202 RepID=A0A1M5ZZR6_9FLAO|nr:hypothetical protein [Cruoricaptor ignavus]SHI29761.1 hypothetical protein SAMN05443429_10173 [Cruoricaptor ignavus]